MLIEKFIDFGIIMDVKIGVCVMVGVVLGLFLLYRLNFFMGLVFELWEFGDFVSVNF